MLVHHCFLSLWLLAIAVPAAAFIKAPDTTPANDLTPLLLGEKKPCDGEVKKPETAAANPQAKTQTPQETPTQEQTAQVLMNLGVLPADKHEAPKATNKPLGLLATPMANCK